MGLRNIFQISNITPEIFESHKRTELSTSTQLCARLEGGVYRLPFFYK